MLHWQTATETNNLGFEIQRKIIQEKVAGEWIIIGYKEGAGTTTEPQEYSYYDDVGGIKATSFSYRLKQIDLDGSYEFSEEVSRKKIFPLFRKWSLKFMGELLSNKPSTRALPSFIYQSLTRSAISVGIRNCVLKFEVKGFKLINSSLLNLK